MTEFSRARVGLLGLMLEQYDETFPDLKPTLEIFGREMAEEIADFATVDFPGVVCSRRQIDNNRLL